MAIFGDSADTQNAIGSLQSGYGAATTNFSPYTQYAGTDFDTARNKLYGEGDDLSQFGNLADQYYGYAEQSPTQMYNTLMKNFRMSPGQMSQMRFSMGALNNRQAATGMSGSGDDLAMHAMVANQLMGQDRQEYLKNVSHIFGVDQDILNDYSRQWNSLNKDFGHLINDEYGAETHLSDIAERLSSEASRDYMQAGRERNKGMSQILGGLTGLSALSSGIAHGVGALDDIEGSKVGKLTTMAMFL